MEKAISDGGAQDFNDTQYRKYIGILFDMLHNKIIDELDILILRNEKNKNSKSRPHFKEANSTLVINGQKIKIARHDKHTNSHKLLKYIFVTKKGNPSEEYFYSEIAQEEFNDSEYHEDKNGWRKYHDAAVDINDKTRKGTKEKIEDFLILNTGKQGRIRLNKKYF